MGAHRKLHFVYRNSFFVDGNPYKQINTGTSYTVYASLLFPGKNAVGILNYAKVIMGRSNTTNPVSFRIIDVTNGGAIIAEVTGQTPSVVGDIIDLSGALGNIPNGEARWDIEMKNDGGSTRPRLYFLGLAGQ